MDTRTAAPARYLAQLLDESVRNRLPLGRSQMLTWALRARAGIPRQPVSMLVRMLPKRADRDVDSAVDAVLPLLDRAFGRSSPPHHVLSVDRGERLTLFLFDGDGRRSAVAKRDHSTSRRVLNEAELLAETEGAGIAPQVLLAEGNLAIQSFLQGGALARPQKSWTEAILSIGRALGRLAEVTAAPGSPARLLRETVSVLGDPLLDDVTKRRVENAAGSLDSISRTVIYHGDVSPQNCLFQGSVLSGLVDWERGGRDGLPGLDLLNASCAYRELDLALRGRKPSAVPDGFDDEWRTSVVWRSVRDLVREALETSGNDGSLTSDLCIAFFAIRLSRRIARPDCYFTGPEATRRMLTAVCAS